MKLKLMVITSRYLEEYLRKSFEDRKELYDIHIEVYENFAHISSLYQENAEQYDGFLVSGKIAREAILKSPVRIEKPVVSFHLNLTDIYKTIVDLLVGNRQIDLSRVIFDFLIPISGDISVQDFLDKENSADFSEKLDQWTEDLDFDHLVIIEESLKREILHLWKFKILDLVICQFSSIIPALEEHKVPYIYPLPSKEHLNATLSDLAGKISLNKMKENYPAVARVFVSEPEESRRIEKHLRQFFSNNVIDCNIDVDRGYIDVILTAAKLSFITDGHRNSKISQYLREMEGKDFLVSYSVGTDFSKAIKNVGVAARESLLKNQSFLKDETGSLTGPLGTDNCIIVSDEPDERVIQIAQKTGLSTNTIQKIIAMRKKDPSRAIASSDLAGQFGTSIRNANRILQKLVQSGYATVKSEKSPNTKGRPTKLYEIEI